MQGDRLHVHRHYKSNRKFFRIKHGLKLKLCDVYTQTHLIVFFGSIFIFMRAFCNLLFGPSVMNPLCSFLASLHGETLESGINNGTPPTSGFSGFTGVIGSTCVDNLARGSVWSLEISGLFTLLRGLGESSGI